jgi:hypothetical protein
MHADQRGDRLFDWFAGETSRLDGTLLAPLNVVSKLVTIEGCRGGCTVVAAFSEGVAITTTGSIRARSDFTK